MSAFLLPVPPVAGGAMGKMWWRLARLYVGRGHQVTLISRRWPGWLDDGTVDGVHLLRVAGHRKRFWHVLSRTARRNGAQTLGQRARDTI